LILCWVACAALVLRARRQGTLRSWCLAGAVAGVALLSKHSAWILITSIGAALLFDSRERRQLLNAGPWLALVLALTVASPNLLWDAARGFPSLTFQLHHGFASSELLVAPIRIAELIAGQAALFTPLVAVAAVWAIWRRPKSESSGHLLWIMAVAPLVVFGGAAVLAQPEANWPAPAHPLLLALCLRRLRAERDKQTNKDGRPLFRRYVAATVVTSALFTALGALHLVSPLPLFPPGTEPAARIRAWHDLPTWLSETGQPMTADTYELAAALSYHLPSRPEITVRCGQEGHCVPDSIALVAAPGDVELVAPAWFSHPEGSVVEMGTASMRRSDGEVVRTLGAYRLVRAEVVSLQRGRVP
jgi:hypothetical protein